MNRLPAATLAIAASAILLVSLAGCAPAAPDGGTGATAAPSSAPAPQAAPVGSSDGACKYLSIGELNSILGRSYTKSENVPLSDPVNYAYCTFTTSGKAAFDLTVSTSDPGDVMSVENQAAGNHLSPLAGVGDSALSDQSELVVQYGQDVIGAGDSTTDPDMKALTLAQLKAVIAKTHSHM